MQQSSTREKVHGRDILSFSFLVRLQSHFPPVFLPLFLLFQIMQFDVSDNLKYNRRQKWQDQVGEQTIFNQVSIFVV